MRRLPALALTLFVTVFALPLAAESSRFDWTASLRVDPGRPLGGGFCGDRDHCDVLGARVPGWGNQVVMLNDTPHVLKDETGLSDKRGDALGFMAGRTAAFGEFAPALQTASFGVVALDGLGVLIFSQPGTQLADSLGVPHMRRYLEGPAFGRTEVWMFLEGQGWPRPIRVEGELTGLVVYP
jgi:hypothetical protein